MSEISKSLDIAKEWLNTATCMDDILSKAKLLQASYEHCLEVLMAYPCEIDSGLVGFELLDKAYSILATSSSHEEISPWAWDCICTIEETLKPCRHTIYWKAADVMLDAGKVLEVQDDLLPRLIKYCEEMVKISNGTYFDNVKKSLGV